MIGTTEIVIVAAVVLVLFGGAAIPKFARSLGRARKEFKEGLADGEQQASQEGAKEAPSSGKREKQA
jgi:sec-independent protein translocase protein TatA